MASHAIIYYTHFINKDVADQIESISYGLSQNFSVFAVGCCPEKTTLEKIRGEKLDSRSYVREELKKLPYPAQLKNVDWITLRRNPDLAIMRFFIGNPEFDFYWIIENDVLFTGEWRDLIEDLSKSPADLLCTHVTSFRQNPGWMHWKSFSSGTEVVAEQDLYRAFLPFSRLSKKLMKAIDERCRRDWAGHPEALWTTIAKSNGLVIEEIGGLGKFTPAYRKGLYYESATMDSGLFLSTFAAWPIYSNKSNFFVSSPRNILWHPVKNL